MSFIGILLNIIWSFIGLFQALLSFPISVEVNKTPPALVFKTRSFWWKTWIKNKKGVRASTIGNVVLIGSRADNKDLVHELIHINQFMQRPLLQPLFYIIESIKHGYKNNKYELEAYQKSGNRYEE